MAKTFLDLLHEDPKILDGVLRGVERECLRMTPDGYLAETKHPRALGSPLTNSYITTDFSEAMLELVTPPLPCIDSVLAWLSDIHQFVYRNIGDELLWPASMPCILRGEEAVPVAKFGKSNKAKFKEVYRIGLKNRYGSLMQSIAGIHYNVSLPDELWKKWAKWKGLEKPLKDVKSIGYFHIIRNFLRLSWIIPYLFGASPALCKTYIKGKKDHGLEAWDSDTAFLPYATSLRMSDIGYQNIAQHKLNVSFDDVESYVDGLLEATQIEEPTFAEIGLIEDGEYKQLNTSILQIENEFYCSIRPKRISRSEERPAVALARHGVEYLEVRSLDVDPFEPTGVGRDQLLFIEGLLIHCLIDESPPFTEACRREMTANMRSIIYEGRRPGLTLTKEGQEISLHEWADEIFSGMERFCPLMDDCCGSSGYCRGLRRQRERVHHPALTPSAQVLDLMKARGHSFFHIAMRQTVDFERFFKSRQASVERMTTIVAEAASSLVAQEAIERKERGSFEMYLEDYFSSTE